MAGTSLQEIHGLQQWMLQFARGFTVMYQYFSLKNFTKFVPELFLQKIEPFLLIWRACGLFLLKYSNNQIRWSKYFYD